MAADPLRPSVAGGHVAGDKADETRTLRAMDLTVRPGPGGTYLLETDGFAMRCAIGRGGMRCDKREGDGATPIGRWPLREVLYRPDRMPAPETRLPVRALAPEDGWCDAPSDPRYNQPVLRPYPASHEEMWRQDGLYDVVVVIGYNDDPVEPPLGSAIFLHICRSDYEPTEGCVAVPLEEMVKLLPLLATDTHIVVSDR